MTKYDIRIRRESFSKGRIERHKDFKKFSGMYEQQRPKGSSTRLLLIILTLVILVAVVLFGYFRVNETPEKEEKAPRPVISQTLDVHLKGTDRTLL